jgi:hypothetical protein
MSLNPPPSHPRKHPSYLNAVSHGAHIDLLQPSHDDSAVHTQVDPLCKGQGRKQVARGGQGPSYKALVQESMRAGHPHSQRLTCPPGRL